jgi:hypothetical protein
MAKVIGGLFSLFGYFCVASVVTVGACVGYLFSNGVLSSEKLDRIAAVLQGVSVPEHKTDEAPKPKDANYEQMSYEERRQLRALDQRQLEMREQSLRSGLAQAQFERKQLEEERDRYTLMQNEYKDQLASLRNSALSAGRENVRLIWENIKPKQAKQQILQMIAADETNEVVAILTAMPIGKRAKIISEFKDPDDVKKMDDILRRVRTAAAEVSVLDAVEQQTAPKSQP